MYNNKFDLDILNKEMEKQVEKFAKNLHHEIVEATPVDTGELKKSISLSVSKTNNRVSSFRIFSNNSELEYSNIIMILGRKKVNGKWIGSNQLPDGILPLIRNRLKSMKFTEKGGE